MTGSAGDARSGGPHTRPANALVAAERLARLGAALHREGRLTEAERCCRRAVRVAPGLADAWFNLGAVLQQMGNRVEAIAGYRQAIALDPALAPAIHNLGCVLHELGRLDKAIAWFRRAVALHPASPLAHRALAVALRDRGLTAEAFACFRRHSELTSKTSTRRADGALPPHRLKHDLEQLGYLARNGLAAAVLLRDEMEHAPLRPDGFHARLVSLNHIECGEPIEPPAVAPRDGTAIETRWMEGRPKVVVVDDLLSPRALHRLRQLCWGSTIWRADYHDGYVGTMMETGFAQPLTLQIATELAAAFPRIFGAHPLLQAWAFKYDSALRGIGVHADFAAVNVNLWIAPDEANLDPAGGGLVIWDQPAPPDWDFAKYNRDIGAIRDFLARSKAIPMRVPHRANRAVIFDSDLFHETDRIDFKDGYLNRRINVTFLYGRRGG